jgi:hypothetical protein
MLNEQTYERPEIFEVGEAEALTLGSKGNCPEECACDFEKDQQIEAY